MLTRRLLWGMVTALLPLASSAARAQSFRDTPPARAAEAFVEDVDEGSACPACQVLLLRDVEPFQTQQGEPGYSPYAPGNGWSLGYDERSSTSDVLVYDGATGTAWLVHTTPYRRLPLLPAASVLELVEVLTLRPGMFWAVGDLDGDGRDDLIGHDKRTGHVVRLFRRGRK